MTTLIYDPDASGHHLDYLTFLVEFLLNQSERVQKKYVFVLNYESKERFFYAENELKFHYLDSEILTHFNSQQSIIWKAKVQFNTLESLSKTYNANRILFMFVDYMQLEIGR